ncbi:MAG TPA: efflux RND transporter periplasmic adaptor subunit [Agriterribacter sp.]|nr:efflux RND transporter periplasmic adaptor subunit [Agriterribacter sp.]
MRCLTTILVIITLTISACQSENTNTGAAEEDTFSETSVTVASPTDTVTLTNQVTLNATATYLLSSDVKANTNGYITKMTIKPADHVGRGAVLFTLETKEARALGNTINKLDPSFRFNGITSVVSPATGYVSMLNHQMGDYVQDGEVLATITDANSFGFVVEVPFEYLNKIKQMHTLPITLPGGEIINGSVAKIMPTADPVSQTVKVLLKTIRSDIPENIIGTIQFSTTTASGLSVPKTAVLTDEAQSSFWVMKLINDSTAVKVPVEKGLETDKFIQIKSGDISLSDKVLTSGNFGLSDTATIQIQK